MHGNLADLPEVREGVLMSAAETETRPAPPGGEIGEYLHFFCNVCNPMKQEDWGVFLKALCGVEVLTVDVLNQVSTAQRGGPLDLPFCEECCRQHDIHPNRCDAHAGKS